MERRDLGSWLDGPGGRRDDDGPPGARLGRPESGPGSLAGLGRRALGILVDWLLCLLIARALIGSWSFGPLVVLVAEHALLVGTAGATVGHRLAGLRVETVAGGAPGLSRALGRAVLLALVIPALVIDRDGRGLHDRLSGTLVARRG